MGSNCCNTNAGTEFTLEEIPSRQEFTNHTSPSRSFFPTTTTYTTNAKPIYDFVTHPKRKKVMDQEISLTKQEEDKMKPVLKSKPKKRNGVAPSALINRPPSIAELVSEMDGKIIANNDKEETNKKISVQSSEGLSQRKTLKFNIGLQDFRRENTGSIEEHYNMLQVIGKGGFGIVRLIEHKLTKERRVVKVMLKSNCQMTENFADEITILQKLVLFLHNCVEIGPSQCCSTL